MALKLIQGKQIATASWATNAISASYSLSSSFAISSSRAISSSFATSASWAPNLSPIAVTGSTLYSTTPVAGPGFGGFNQDSIFLGSESGQNATSADNSNFLGNRAGYQATSARYSNFLGYLAGTNATNANNSNFLGYLAGTNATSANNSNFLGRVAGYQATSANYSNFIGWVTGYRAVSASFSNLVGNIVGSSDTAANSIGRNNIIIGTGITLAPQQKDSINLGGIIFATGSYFSTATDPISTFSGSVSNAKVGICTSTPEYTLDVSGSLRVTNGITGSLFGTSSWAVSASFATSASSATSASFTLTASYISPTFISASAAASGFGSGGGTGTISVAGSTLYSTLPAAGPGFNTDNSILLGEGAGQNATNANNSNFLGQYAGTEATNASYSNFLGYGAGAGANSASYSTLLGYLVGYDETSANSIGSNNIIIGTGITLAPQQKDSINLGGIIFATGSYFNTQNEPYSGSQYGIGMVGINVVHPSYTLEVGGTVSFPDINNTASPDVLYRNQITGEITYAAAPTATSATVNEINTPNNSNVFIRPLELEQSKHTTINIYNNLNFI